MSAVQGEEVEVFLPLLTKSRFLIRLMPICVGDYLEGMIREGRGGRREEEGGGRREEGGGREEGGRREEGGGRREEGGDKNNG